MEFLFHTVVELNGRPVYFNVLSVRPNVYFFQILQNPWKVDTEEGYFNLETRETTMDWPEREVEKMAELLQEKGM